MSVHEKILKGLKEAITAEGDGYNFYMLAAENTSDEKGKEVFQMLAREEGDHIKYLRTQYESILNDGVPNSGIKLPKRKEFEGASPIFSSGLKSRIKDAHMEMSALSIGIQLELNAIKHYRDQAEIAEDPTIKDFFMELVEWESGHYELLSRQQEYLKEDYWAAGGFSPF
jgi:rubrerythrin